MNVGQDSCASAGRIGIEGRRFRDRRGRHVILRGVNFGGDSKVPYTPNGHTYIKDDFSGHRSVSFVGRPAPLDEIDAHLGRLAHWGFNCIRLLTTWEAVEHAGPGEHDEAYLDYYAEVCRRAGQHGLHVYVDFHQDAWSRMSGGDGAPGWTLEAAGLDFARFGETGAAHLMQYAYDQTLGGRQADYPVMSWSGNYARPANGVMWTLFFAGADFAPSLNVDGRSIQAYLQEHYLGAVRAVAERVAALDNVIGFDTLNEPGTGYIAKAMTAPIVRYRGPVWSVLDGLALASGLPRELAVVEPFKGVVGKQTLNADGHSIWRPGREDPFRAAGAWDIVDGRPQALREDYFQTVAGRTVDLGRDYMAPFFNQVAQTIRSFREDWLLFAEVDPFEAVMGHGFPAGCPERTVNASHWYDLSAFATKRFDPERLVHVITGEVREGSQAIEDGYTQEMERIRAAGDRLNAGAPSLLGECGIAYDMNDAEAYRRWAAGERDRSVWEVQSKALELMYNAIDRLLLSSTQWNYAVSNRNDPMVGDGWNQEDLSIWSVDQLTSDDDPDSGGRAVEGFCRPFVRAAQGALEYQRFDRKTGVFEASIDVDPAIALPTEIYVPQRQYARGFNIALDGEGEPTVEGQFLRIRASRPGPLAVRLMRR